MGVISLLYHGWMASAFLMRVCTVSNEQVVGFRNQRHNMTAINELLLKVPGDSEVAISSFQAGLVYQVFMLNKTIEIAKGLRSEEEAQTGNLDLVTVKFEHEVLHIPVGGVYLAYSEMTMIAEIKRLKNSIRVNIWPMMSGEPQIRFDYHGPGDIQLYVEADLVDQDGVQGLCNKQ